MTIYAITAALLYSNDKIRITLGLTGFDGFSCADF